MTERKLSSPSAVRRLRELNEFDIEVYRYVEKTYLEQRRRRLDSWPYNMRWS